MVDIVPVLRRIIFERLHGLKSRSPRIAYWRDLEKTQFFPVERLLELQWRRLMDILGFSWEHNDYYRQRFQAAGLSADEIRSPMDMRRIPILTKEEIRANTDSMISHGYSIQNLQQAKTGGSTGKALELYFSEECSELRNACARRHDRWSGWEPGEPVAAVWGNPHYPFTIKEKLKEWLLEPMIYLDTMKVNTDSVKNFAVEWQRSKPTLLYGHAHSIYLLALFIKELGISEIKPKGILSTSMMLLPHERKVIEDVFNLKVTDRYGCEEVSLIASECERHEGMHLNIEHLYIEFIKEDGTPAGPGEPGKIVVTDLMNKAMPFIRYQVEDIGVLTDRKCSCGRGLPLMESVTGRVADFLIKKDGTKVAGVSLIENTLTRIPGIDQMQIIQESISRITLNLVVNNSFKKDQEIELKEYFCGLFGNDTELSINHKVAIAQEPNGKYRFSICKLSQ
jgi:phenylacetate-CoA ligase